MKYVETEVVHSKSKDAWNVIGQTVGCKYKIARVPYLICDNEILNTMAKSEALEHAEFISRAFNKAYRERELK